MLSLLVLLIIIVLSNAEDLTVGDHLHVSLQFLHQDTRTKWISFPANQLPLFMKRSTSVIPVSLSEMKINTLKPLKVCFELTDMHIQTSWITVYDGRGVFAENVNLLILVRDKNVVWVDVEVEYYKSIFHTGDPLPGMINVNFKWNVEYSYNSDRGFVVVMWCSMVITTLTVLGVIYVSEKQYVNEIRKQQFRQPIKTTKSD
ncbi:uncharacterized protein [Blastocystis hominis]|uniref:Signal sequence receptor subunit alpha n=1 Tax=Blastocystis hominis TaxID=12968 RepID=D8M2I0_BLAHO|nr:uncharacterized protein [Blastocystis hominis]CBK22269.2 unnamed protein product [Blastocystis hominis]|eukprot:XP_012896317.1 uncharacterized protein [Blastocystis hominis]